MFGIERLYLWYRRFHCSNCSYCMRVYCKVDSPKKDDNSGSWMREPCIDAISFRLDEQVTIYSIQRLCRTRSHGRRLRESPANLGCLDGHRHPTPPLYHNPFGLERGKLNLWSWYQSRIRSWLVVYFLYIKRLGSVIWYIINTNSWIGPQIWYQNVLFCKTSQTAHAVSFPIAQGWFKLIIRIYSTKLKSIGSLGGCMLVWPPSAERLYRLFWSPLWRPRGGSIPPDLIP